MNFYKIEKFLITANSKEEIQKRFKGVIRIFDTQAHVHGKHAFFVTFYTKVHGSYVDLLYGKEKRNAKTSSSNDKNYKGEELYP